MNATNFPTYTSIKFPRLDIVSNISSVFVDRDIKLKNGMKKNEETEKKDSPNKIAVEH